MLIDANAELSLPVSNQRLKSVTWKHEQVCFGSSGFQDIEASFRLVWRRLQAINPSPAGRRWVYVSYDQRSDQIGPLAREPAAELGIVLIENPAKAARQRDEEVFEEVSRRLQAVGRLGP